MVCLLHGAYCGAAIWSTYFLPWFAARGWHTYALSLEGHGRSEGHGWLAALSIDDYVRNLSDVVVTFPTPPVLIAHSMGGFVLQRYLERENPSAGNVLLASVPPRGLTQSSLRLLQHSPAVFSTLNIFQSDGVRQIPLERTKRLLFSDDLPAELLISWLPTFQAESMRAIFDMLMVGLLTPLPLLTQPSLVLGAADDPIISPQEVEDTAKRFHVTAEMIPHTGHVMMLDTRWEQVAHRVLTWLTQNGI